LKNLKLILQLLFLLPSFNYSQVNTEWIRRYNGSDNRFDIANSLRLDNSSNVYVYGSTASTGTSTDIVAIKYNTSGSVLWTALYNGFGNSVDQVRSTYLDNAGNSYLTGFTADTNLVIKVVTFKIDPNGSIQWKNIFLPPSYSQGRGEFVTKDNSNNIFALASLSRVNGSFALFLLKYDQNGSLTDTARFNVTSSSSEVPVGACIDGAGNIYVLGSTNAISGTGDILLLKYSNSLELLWQYSFSGTGAGSDMPVQILFTSDNKLAVAAAMRNTSSGLDYGLFRFDTNAALIMQYIYDGTGSDQDIPYALTCDNSNNIFVTGSSRNSDTLGSEDILTLKIDPTALLLWERRYNGTGRGIDYGTAITVDNSGNVYAGGTTDKHNIHLAYALLKYGPTGDALWLEEYSAQELSEDFVYSVAVDNNYNVFVTGISFDSLHDYDIATIKYSQPIGIQQISSEVPGGFMLFQNYPNPFNPMTNIKIQMSKRSQAKLTIYHVNGKEVVVLINRALNEGTYEYSWDASNYPSGVYFYELKTADFKEVRKMVLLK
jgi:Secretion system C-terminal sorting domain/Beta-propeller repeat